MYLLTVEEAASVALVVAAVLLVLLGAIIADFSLLCNH